MAWLEDTLRKKLASRKPNSAARLELRPAAVLMPLVKMPDDYHVLLTRRSALLRRQPGDISFPGGAIDENDPSALAAALRESQEEVGLDSKDVDILGQMDEYETVTGFRITPFVGLVSGPYSFRPNREVEEMILAPLSALRTPESLQVEYRRHRGRRVRVYHFLYEHYDIWGITGRLIKELLDLIPAKP